MSCENVFFETFIEEVKANTKYKVPEHHSTERAADGHLYVVTQRSETRMRPMCQVCLCLSVLFVCLALLAWLTQVPFIGNQSDTTVDADAVATFDCNVAAATWKTDWHEAKKEYCCARMNRGCEFNCDLGGPAEWTVKKKDFCCQGSDCAGLSPHFGDAAAAGSDAGSAGGESQYDCTGSPEAWPLNKRAWCCDHGTPEACKIHMDMPYDCEAGYKNWKAGWSDPKKKWCCDQLGVACESHVVPHYHHPGHVHVVPAPVPHHHSHVVPVPVPSVHHYYQYPAASAVHQYRPYHCYQGTNMWMSTWSMAKKSYCCKRHSVFCVHTVHHPKVVHVYHYGHHAVGSGAHHIPQCSASQNNCPAEWTSKSPGGYHCLHKLARQTSEAAYQASGGACRPAAQGPFPYEDCHDQCYVGVAGSGGSVPVSSDESYAGDDDIDFGSDDSYSGSFGAAPSVHLQSTGGSYPGVTHFSSDSYGGSFGSGAGVHLRSGGGYYPGVTHFGSDSYGGSFGSGSFHHSSDSFGGSFSSFHDHAFSGGAHHQQSNVLNLDGISPCLGSDHKCPSEWMSKSLGGFHCLHKLARQTSEAAYKASGGACRPAEQGPFPHGDCHAQCYVGVAGSASSVHAFGAHPKVQHLRSSGGGSHSSVSHFGSGSYGGSFGSGSFHHSSGSFGGSFSGHHGHSFSGGLHHQHGSMTGIPPCLGSDHRCPAEWLSGSSGGFHCKHKLARQTSESAYQASGGACRPAKEGAFPHNDCQDQCSIGKV